MGDAFVTSISLPLPIPLAFNVKIDARVLLFTIGAAIFSRAAGGARARGAGLEADPSSPTCVAIDRWGVRGQHALDAARLAGHRPDSRDRGAARRRGAVDADAASRAQRTNVGFPVEQDRDRVTDTTMRNTRRSAAGSSSTTPSRASRPFPASKQRRSRRACRSRSTYNRWDVWIPDHHHPGEHGDYRGRDVGLARLLRNHGRADRRRPGVQRPTTGRTRSGWRSRTRRSPGATGPVRARSARRSARACRMVRCFQIVGVAARSQGARPSASRRRRSSTSRSASGRAPIRRSSRAPAATQHAAARHAPRAPGDGAEPRLRREPDDGRPK